MSTRAVITAAAATAFHCRLAHLTPRPAQVSRRADRLFGEEPREVGGQLAGRCVTLSGVFGQRLEHDRFHVERDCRIEPSQRAGLVGGDPPQKLGSVVSLEDLPERQELVKRRSERIDVAPAVDGTSDAAGLFGAQIARGPDHVAARRQVAVAPDSGQPEVGDPETVIGADQQIRWLDVAVEYLVAVGVIERLGRLPAEFGDLLSRETAAVALSGSATTSAKFRPSISRIAKYGTRCSRP